MKVGDLVKVTSSDSTYRGLIIDIDDDIQYSYLTKFLFSDFSIWRNGSQLQKIEIDQLTPQEFQWLSTKDVFRLMREKLSESR